MTAPFFLLATLLACAPAPDASIENQLVDVGCGTCIYRLPDGVGCYWAIELEGKQYAMAGELPKDHQNHGPDGMCNMKRQARVTGELRGSNFISSSFELIAPDDIPAERKYDEHDEHGKDYRAPDAR